VELARDFSQRRARREIVEGLGHDQSAAWVESGLCAIIIINNEVLLCFVRPVDNVALLAALARLAI
jgi:hypothetical protein